LIFEIVGFRYFFGLEKLLKILNILLTYFFLVNKYFGWVFVSGSGYLDRLREFRIQSIIKSESGSTILYRAPVKSVVYDTPYTRVNQFSINLVVELYRTDLEVYVHRQLPRFSRSRSFHERADSAYLYLIRQCPYIHTLMIRERISSCTVLLLAYTGKNLRYFHVRRNGIILKCDWPKSPDWSDEFYAWLRRTSKSYKDMETEVSQILGFRWYALTDKQFKLTHVNLNYQHYYEGFEEAG